MANITVSTTSNFDDAGNLALLNGETITVTSDAALTINSDVRWGQNAAVPFTITLTQGKLLIDGSQTWWIPFDASTGNVPALGTCGTPDVTRGGSNVGEFLGVFTALGVAPSASGGAMPATGFVKLRTKSTTLADNDVLTFAGGATITINSATGGQSGWLHFVGREATGSTNGLCSIPRLGELQTLGDWFVLGTSNGATGQTFQHYVADFVPALQVETGNGTGIYEWWGCALAADWNSTVISTDERGRFYDCSSSGLITFGGATFGKLPPNGARIRVPNVHISTAPSTNYALNVLPLSANRYSFVSSGGIIDASFVSCNGSFGSSNAPLYKVTNSCGADGAWKDNIGTNPSNVSQVLFNNVAAARITTYSVQHFGLTYCFNAEYINCASFKTSGSSGSTVPINMVNVTNLTIDGLIMLSAGGTGESIQVQFCNGVTIKNSFLIQGAGTQMVGISGSTDVVISNIGIGSRLTDSGTQVSYACAITNCNNVLIDTIYLWAGNAYPLLSLFNISSQTKNIRIRNIGTRSSPISLGSTTRYVVNIANSTDIFLSKIYAGAGTQSTDSVINISNCDNFIVSDVGDPTSPAGQVYYVGTATNTTFYKRSATGGSKIYQSTAVNGRTLNTFTAFGTHFVEEEVSSTEIQLTVNAGTEKSTYQSSLDAYIDDVGTILRGGTNDLLLRTLNDQVTWTWNYWIRGLTGFANTTAVLSGTNTGNFSISYDLDKGQGFSGTFKAATGANLSAETGILATGVKLKVRAICTTANSANVLRTIGIYGTTTASTLENNPYPYNEPLVKASGSASGSTAAVFRNSDGKLLDVKSGASTIELYPEWFSDTTCTIRVRTPGYDSVISEFTLVEAGLFYPVSQTDNAISNTNPGSRAITVTNHGASPVTWNSKTWSITVTVTDGSSASQIAHWLSWNTSQNNFSLGGGFNNLAWPAMVVAVGTNFETARGQLFGSAGAALKGVRIVDGSGNEMPGFARMQADDGTYYSPASSYTLTISNIVTNSRLLVRRTDTLAVLINETITGTSRTYTYTYSADIPIEIVLRKATTSPFYQEWKTTTILTNSNNSQTANQIIDE